MEQPKPLNNREVEARAQQYTWPPITDYGRVNTFGERFPLVSTLSMFMRILGILLLAGGVGIFAMEFLPWVSCKPPQLPPQQPGFFQPQVQATCPLALWELGAGGVMFVIGLGIVAVGELLGMFRSIEGNTHNMLKVAQEEYKRRLVQGL